MRVGMSDPRSSPMGIDNGGRICMLMNVNETALMPGIKQGNDAGLITFGRNLTRS
jgi:hypothetical protein